MLSSGGGTGGPGGNILATVGSGDTGNGGKIALTAGASTLAAGIGGGN